MRRAYFPYAIIFGCGRQGLREIRPDAPSATERRAVEAKAHRIPDLDRSIPNVEWLLAFPHGWGGESSEDAILDRVAALTADASLMPHPPWLWLVPTERKRLRTEMRLALRLGCMFHSGIWTIQGLADAACPPDTAAIGMRGVLELIRGLVRESDADAKAQGIVAGSGGSGRPVTLPIAGHALTVKSMADFFNRLEHEGITSPDDLEAKIREYRRGAPAPEHRSDADRFLAQIFRAYRAALRDMGAESPADRILALSGRNPRRPPWLPSGLRLLAVEGFYDLTVAQARAVAALAGSADRTIICLDWPDLFSPVAKVVAGMADALIEAGLPSPKLKRPSDGRRQSYCGASSGAALRGTESGAPSPARMRGRRGDSARARQVEAIFGIARPPERLSGRALGSNPGLAASRPSGLSPDPAKEARVELVEAEDRREEVREIARRICALIESDPSLALSDIAVIFPDLETYAHLVEETFEEYAVEFHICSGRPAARLPVTRSLLSLLRAAARGARREDMLEIAACPMFDFHAAGVPLDWEKARLLRTVAVEADLRGGGDFESAWLRPIEGILNARRAAAERAEEAVERGEMTREEAQRVKAAPENLEALLDAMRKLRDMLEPMSGGARVEPRDHALRIYGMFEKLRVRRRIEELASKAPVYTEEKPPADTEEEGPAASPFPRTLDSRTMGLDVVVECVAEAAAAYAASARRRSMDFAEFMDAVEDILSEKRYFPESWNPDGVQVLGWLDARGLTFRRVFFGGLIEDALPGADSARFFPPLPGVPGIPSHDISRPLEGRFLFAYHALNGTDGCVLSWPRKVGDGPVTPCIYVASLARFLPVAGRRGSCGAGNENQRASAPAIGKVGSACACDAGGFPKAVVSAREALEAAAEAARTAIASGAPIESLDISPLKAAVAAGLAGEVRGMLRAMSVCARRSDPADLSPYTGHLGPGAAAAAMELAFRVARGEDGRRVPARRVSASFLESYAACPARFFFEEVVGLSAEPEILWDVSPKDRGKLIHVVLRRFTDKRTAAGGAGWFEGSPDEAGKAVEEMKEELERALSELDFRDDPFVGVFRDGLLDLSDRENPSGALADFVREEIELAANSQRAMAPKMLEVMWTAAVPWDVAEVLGSELAGNLWFAARIDRCDALRACGAVMLKSPPARNTVAIYDYKTGGDMPGKTGMLSGFHLQLPFYLLIARLRGLDPCAAAIYEVRPWGRVGRKAFVWMKNIGPVLMGTDPSRRHLDLSAGDLADSFLEETKKRIRSILGAIAAGLFPPAPAGADECRRCPFGRVCGMGGRDADVRKRRLAGIAGLRMYFPEPFRIGDRRAVDANGGAEPSEPPERREGRA